MDRCPLIIVYTGNGKGKTTAAMGQVMRVLGHKGKCAVIQFIKPDSLETGEKLAALAMGVLWKNFGEGFTWNSSDISVTANACRSGWEQAKRWMSSGLFDLVVLDEFTYAMNEDYVAQNDVLDWLSDHKSQQGFPHLIITGRGASSKLLQIADLVTEMVEIKHPFAGEGLKAQKMIEH